MKVPVDDCQELIDAREDILEAFQLELDSNFEKTGYASFGKKGTKEITFKRFEGMNVVDIREYYTNLLGDRSPSKNGVMFNAEFLPEVLDKIKFLLGFCAK